jgi:N-acetylglucosamine-6-phosphate deacetylase
MTVLSNARIVTPGGVLACGYLVIEHGTITAVGTGDPPAPALDLAGAWLLPGFIDLHMHGGGGHAVAASADDMAAALAFHRRHGTTRSLISLVTAPLDALARQLGWVADLVAAGPADAIGAVGAHLEGPFLSQARCGAQNPAHLLLPDRTAFAGLVESAAGSLRSVTIAPELPSALALISDVRAAGAVAAIGHSDAGYTEARAGIIGAAIDSGLACEVINDGIHVHPAITALVARSPESLVLVTDAIDATGVGDGEFQLGGQRVRVQDGQARLAGSATLAGSTLTMDDALRRAVLDCGLPIEIAAAGAATNPARVLGLDNLCGSIAVGLDADLVVLDDDLRVVRVMAGGQWCGVEAPQFNGMATSAPTTN